MANSTDEMSFLDHLEALRWHLVRSVVAIVVIAIAAFVNKSFLFDQVIFGPKNADFITFELLCKFSAWLHAIYPDFVDADFVCIGQNMPPLQNITMAGQFTTHIMVSMVGGFVMAFPYVFYEMWSFIKPGLKQTEIKITRGVVFFTSILFTLGVLFGYFIITPLTVNFFATYNVSDEIANLPTLSTYISTITTVTLASGLIFELPMLIYFLTRLGIVTPAFLKAYRRHSIVVSLILAAVITPPDVFSQLLVVAPLIVLYEISITISRRTIKRMNKELAN